MSGPPERALVTGGAGFIGSHLCERLLADGHEVIVLDDLSTGSRATIETLASRGRLRFEHVDVADHAAIAPLFVGVDWVFHLAGRADIVPSIQQPLVYHRANVDGTAAVLEAARAAGVRRLVYAASSSCYGIPDAYPTSEDAPCRPQYPYALTKYLGEQLVRHWAQVYRLPCVSLRLFNVYGPRSRTTGAYGAVFGVFLAQKRAGRAYTVVGDGRQTRDFIYVSDVAEAFVRAARADIAGGVFNVGTGQPHAIRELVALLGGPVEYLPKRPGEPDATQADVRRIGAALGWTPRVSLAEGVGRMLERIDDWRDAPVWTRESIAAATRDWFAQLGPEGRT